MMLGVGTDEKKVGISVVRDVGGPTAPHTTRQLAVPASPVESTDGLVDWPVCSPIASDPGSLSEQVGMGAPSYSIGCAAAEEHSWGAGDRQGARGTLSGMRERKRERERERAARSTAPRVRPYLVVRRTSASLQQVPNTRCSVNL